MMKTLFIALALNKETQRDVFPVGFRVQSVQIFLQTITAILEFDVIVVIWGGVSSCWRFIQEFNVGCAHLEASPSLPIVAEPNPWRTSLLIDDQAPFDAYLGTNFKVFKTSMRLFPPNRHIQPCRFFLGITCAVCVLPIAGNGESRNLRTRCCGANC